MEETFGSSPLGLYEQLFTGTAGGSPAMSAKREQYVTELSVWRDQRALGASAGGPPAVPVKSCVSRMQGEHSTRFYLRFQRTPSLVSSRIMPRLASSSRISSARPKSRRRRASCRSSIND